MHRQDFRVLLLYHLCSLCSLPLEESQVPGGGLAGRGHPDVLQAPSCRGTEQGKATLPAICILQGWKGPSSPSHATQGQCHLPVQLCPRGASDRKVSPLLTLRVPTSLWIHKDMASALYLCITLQAHSIQKICHKRHEY